jgi:hypothetical protein
MGVHFRSPPWTKKATFTPICNVPWRGTSVVLSDGRVNFCCFSDVVIGNVKQDTFEAIWTGPVMQEIRELLSKGIIPDACSKPSCPIFRGDQRTHLWEKMRGSYYSEDAPVRLELDSLRRSFASTFAEREQNQLVINVQATGVRKPVQLVVGQIAPKGFQFGPNLQAYPRPIGRLEMNEPHGLLRIDSSKFKPNEPLFAALFDVDSNPNIDTNCFWCSVIS